MSATVWLPVATARKLLQQPLAAGLVSYQLGIEVGRPVEVQVGRFGRYRFAAGLYVYTGSARRAYAARLRRHLSREKKLRWHIDYLLAARGVRVVAVAMSEVDECALNQALAGEVVLPGFGASDCRQHCGAHLKQVRPGCFGG